MSLPTSSWNRKQQCAAVAKSLQATNLHATSLDPAWWGWMLDGEGKKWLDELRLTWYFRVVIVTSGYDEFFLTSASGSEANLANHEHQALNCVHLQFNPLKQIPVLFYLFFLEKKTAKKRNTLKQTWYIFSSVSKQIKYLYLLANRYI